MIKPSKIQEWIEEIESRPMVAPFIVRTLSARAIELDKINEELRAENIALRSGQKTEEYERKIAELEYQLELLKRQVKNGEVLTGSGLARLLAYDAEGRLLGCEFTPSGLIHEQSLAMIRNFTPPHRDDMHLIAVGEQAELLLMFDSGRIETRTAIDMPVTPASELDWNQPFQIEMRSGERLIAILDISTAPLKNGCIQVSRKGMVRRISQDYFQSFLREGNIGKGVRTAVDQPLNLVLCNPEDTYVLSSRNGYICAMPAEKLSIALEEMIKLEMKDYLVSAFALLPEENLVFALESGELYRQDSPWTDPGDADGSKRRLLLGGARTGGVQMIMAGAAASQDWVFTLTCKGAIRMTLVGDIRPQKRKGKEPTEGDPIITACLWHMPQGDPRA